MTEDLDRQALWGVATRLKGELTFMAGVIAAYQQQLGIDDRRLAHDLGCDVSALIDLSLCRAPRRSDANVFANDVKSIAQYTGCNWQELAKIARTVQSLARLQENVGDHRGLLLKAARDKERKPPDSPKPGKRKAKR